MYVTDAKATVAIDVATGKQIWKTPVDWPADMVHVVCCGVSNKGAAIYDGKVFRGTLDAFVIALDMKTGKELWREKAAEWKDGYTITGAPLVANGVLITGISGAEYGTRGFLDGWDPQTGKHLWRRYTVPAPGEKGSETWPAGDAYTHGGGSTWITGSYDPDLDLVYWGTGNAGPWNAQKRPGDNLYTASLLAIRPKTGEIAWYYQFTPNDMYDYDAVWEPILADITVAGQPRKVVMQFNRNGFLYVLDRTNGKLIAANPYEKVNWAKEIDLKTGRPVLTDLLERAMKGETVNVFPSRGTNATLIAFNPKTNLVYVNSWNFPRLMKYVDFKFTLGAGSTGIESTMTTPPGEPAGYHMAIEPLTGKVVWQQPMMDFASSAGVLATDGGLLFTGLLTGEVIALDQDSGKRLWQFKTGSSVNAPPITYMYKGRQYVTVLSGRGGSVAGRLINDLVPAGGSVWTFALME